MTDAHRAELRYAHALLVLAAEHLRRVPGLPTLLGDEAEYLARQVDEVPSEEARPADFPESL